MDCPVCGSKLFDVGTVFADTYKCFGCGYVRSEPVEDDWDTIENVEGS